MKKILTLCTLLAMCCSFNTQANAATLGPIKWDVNGHYYEVIDAPLTWDEAKLAAESSMFMGVQGHLATINSAAENFFISNNFGGITGLANHWLGGYQPEENPVNDLGWVWVTGESWAFTNWQSGEPNNAGDGEDALTYWTGSNINIGVTWNDAPRSYNYGTNGGYVVEYPVPEPSSLILGLMGISGALRFRKKRNNK